MTHPLALVDGPGVCGTPAQLRWHLAHGETCQRCDRADRSPTPTLCHRCGTTDRPAVAAHVTRLEAENARLTAEVIRLAAENRNLAADVTPLRRQAEAARQAFEALLAVPTIRHEAVERARRVVFGPSVKGIAA